MLVRVTCGGILIGTAKFDPPQGVAHASLLPTAAYVLASSAAQSLAARFARTQFWSADDGDFADIAASRWEGRRLGIEDMKGRQLGANNIVVLDGVRGGPGESAIRVVADFRSDVVGANARIRATGTSGGKRTRPAA